MPPSPPLEFLVDQNLPVGLLPVLDALGHRADHVKLRGLSEASDQYLWALAAEEGRIMISKDTDFLTLARRSEAGSLLWLSVGNCSNVVLYALVKRRLHAVVEHFQNGDRIVEIGT